MNDTSVDAITSTTEHDNVLRSPPSACDSILHASRKRLRHGSGSQSTRNEESSSLDSHAVRLAGRRSGQKVSRACDFCKRRKARCTGTLPCAKCTKKGLACHYDSKYSRGRPPTPPLSTAITAQDRIEHSLEHDIVESCEQDLNGYDVTARMTGAVVSSGDISRPCADNEQTYGSSGNDSSHPTNAHGSPELGMAEIEGQVFDPTSGVTFLHRAWSRLSKGSQSVVIPPGGQGYPRSDLQPLMLAGDLPLPHASDEDLARVTLQPFHEAQTLITFYYEICIVTYRILHRPSVESWLSTVLQNIQQARPLWYRVGRARAATLLAVLAIATAHEEKNLPNPAPSYDEMDNVRRSDQLFAISIKLTDDETGPPRLESAQARVTQTFYLLLSSRMNLAWYTFGTALQIISALGLHRKAPNKHSNTPSSVDYIQSQMRIRTFWTAYILDKYLGVIMGRPRHYHDDDIDQIYPDRIEDEDMSIQGPLRSEDSDSHVDALIYHAKIAKIIGAISREVYSIKPISEQERYAAAHRLSQELRDWKQDLPAYLGSIRPSMLVRSLRRQSQVLQVAYSHGIMHANRLFLLGNPTSGREIQILECVGAARTVLELFDRMAGEGPTVQAFWWTHYVAFQALVICYVWDIQRKRWRTALEDDSRHARLMVIADRCQTHLAHATAKNSPSRRYAVILEMFRSEALGHTSKQPVDETKCRRVQHLPAQPYQHQVMSSQVQMGSGLNVATAPSGQEMQFIGDGGDVCGSSLLDQWQTTDWLELDASAFGLYMGIDTESFEWAASVES